MICCQSSWGASAGGMLLTLLFYLRVKGRRDGGGGGDGDVSAAVVSAVRECERLRDLMWGGYINWVEERGSALVPGHCHYTGGGNEVSWMKYLHHLPSLPLPLSLTGFLSPGVTGFFFIFYTFLWVCCEKPERVGSWPILPCKARWTVSLLNIPLSRCFSSSAIGTFFA